MAHNEIPGRKRVGSPMLAALAAPAMPLAAMTLPLTIFLPEFYATTIGINLAVVGIVFTVVRLADLVFDPFIGGLIDRTHSRWGAYKPWLLGGAPVVMIGAWLLFMAEPGASASYLAIALIVTYAGYSLVTLAQMGLGASLTTEYGERSRVFAWWQLFNMGGVLLVLVIPYLLGRLMPQDGDVTVRAMGWFVLLTAPITIITALAFVRGGKREIPVHTAKMADYVSLLRLRSARLLLGSVMMIGLGLGISSAVFVFYFTTVKDVGRDTFSLILAWMFTINILSSPFWAWIGNRIGKHRALALGCTGTALYLLSVLVMPSGNMIFLFAAFTLGGVSGCSADILPRAMMADVSDEDRLRSGSDRTGMLYALLLVTIKIGQAVAIGIVYVVLDLIGFHAGAGNSAGSLLGVTLIYCIAPALCQLSAAFLAFRYPLSASRHDVIREALEAQHIRAASDDIAPEVFALGSVTANPLPIRDEIDAHSGSGGKA